ncbi:MAG TPA: Uma2 family endonuclease [Pseudonocardiaceae bacterium]|nr:Uma2 family endonuclease [Pseudonocardiaceae bacterium]
MTSAHKRRLADFTLDDWDNLEPIEGQRVELVDGLFRVNAAPTPWHQQVGDELRTLLGLVVKPLGLRAITAIAVRVRAGLGYIPDVVVCKRIAKGATSVTVDTVFLAVEIVSPSSRKIDRFEKPAAYAAAGIPAYWRVELVKNHPPTVHCYELDNGIYVETATVETGKPRQVVLPFGAKVTIDVDALDE